MKCTFCVEETQEVTCVVLKRSGEGSYSVRGQQWLKHHGGQNRPPEPATGLAEAMGGGGPATRRQPRPEPPIPAAAAAFEGRYRERWNREPPRA